MATFIFQNVILGLLKHKTRIVCTHQTRFLVHADVVLNMLQGRIVSAGNPSKVLPDLEDLLLSAEPMPAQLTNADVAFIEDSKSQSSKVAVNKPLTFAIIQNSSCSQFEDEGVDSLLKEEQMEKGSLKLGVCGTYMKAVGPYLVASIFMSMILMQTSRNFTDV